MKPNTPELLKFKKLQRLLRISVAECVGHLELLWIATQKNTPQGNIGKFSNEDIAIACCWDGDPDEFVAALVKCNWLDPHDEHRLIVHDWAQHCPSWVTGSLARHGRTIFGRENNTAEQLEKNARHDANEDARQVAKEPAKDGAREPAREPARDATTYPILPYPNQTNPSPSYPNQPASPCSQVNWRVRWSEVGEGEFFQRVRESANRFHVRRIKLDRDYVWQCCWVACEFDQWTIDDTCDRLARRGEVRKPRHFVEEVMRNLCDRHGERWESLRKLVPPTPPPPETISQLITCEEVT